MTPLTLPESLTAHAIWSPPDDDATGAGSIVYVTERRRRRLAMMLPAPFLILVVVALVTHVTAVTFLAVVFGVACVAAVAMHHGGRAGFYRLTRDGELGEYLGKQAPDTSGLHRRRVTDEDVR